MIGNDRVVVVLPAYNAEKTLERTIREIDSRIVDEIICVDDASMDNTLNIAKNLDLKTFHHPENKGYGGNQKTCYQAALDESADIIIMLHPDYQYTPKLIPAMAHLIHTQLYDIVLGSRILTGGAIRGGMPVYKYIGNRILTLIENMLLRQKLSEYHTGYRAFHRRVLETLPVLENSDDFVFDNEMLAQAFLFGFRVGEISCPARYDNESSSINFRRSVLYGWGVLWTSVRYRLQRMELFRFRIFNPNGKKLRLKSHGNNDVAPS
ncbi:glycosyltransferase family 2 protein [bacterium]|nr:glycosyltransferase family 2 protein [bacterium]